MRIGGGRARGTRLQAKGGRGVRPTSTLVTDAVFNSLAARIAGACVLDLFAGTGRLGIEALSRGAREAVFVERDARNAALIRQNLAAAGLADRGVVRQADALAAAAGEGERRRFDLIFLDPPYGRGLAAEALRRVAAGTVLAAGGLVIAEGHWRDDPGEIAGLARVRTARYGETAVWVYARAAGREEGA